MSKYHKKTKLSDRNVQFEGREIYINSKRINPIKNVQHVPDGYVVKYC